MDLQSYGTWVAGLLTAIAVAAGVLFKRGIDKQNARDAKENARLDREAAERKSDIDQMQENLSANRTELRGVQDDLIKARGEMGQLWSQLNAVRRELDAERALNGEWERWADAGAQGPRPVRKHS